MSSPNDSNKDASKQPATPQQQHNRRASITDFFNRSQGSYSGPVTSAVAEANQRRRMSVAGTSPINSSGTTSNFLNSFAARRGSVSSVSSAGSGSAIADDDSGEGGSPKGIGSAFARRMSFGAKAMMDVKTSRQVGFMSKEKQNTAPTTGQTQQPTHQTQASESLPQPVDSMPKAPMSPPKPPPKKHDAMQERMLRGEFLMD